jgi:tetratricopeptide (TPR) repeat protein
LLRSGARWAVVRGQGGEGKTALVAELARWMVRSHQVRRAAFVSVEGLEKNIAESVLDKLGDQLVKRGFSTQAECQGDLEKAERQIARVLREQRERPTLLVMDNMESVLLPQFLADETLEALSQESRDELTAVLALCERLVAVGETRLVFTSREALPAPFDAERQRRELSRLGREDAVKLVERVVDAEGGATRGESRLLDARQEAIERLVEAVHCHARTLALLAPALRSKGIEETRESLVELMAEMEERFPGSREQSVFASVELSLRRMSAENRERVRVLGVFHGGVQLRVLRVMTEWEVADLASLAAELVATGLATLNRYDHLTLNPALCPYLRAQLDRVESEPLTARWIGAMRGYVGFLVQQQNQNTEVAATLTVLELPNLFALLGLVERAGDAEGTIGLATSLYVLLQALGKPRLLERVGQVREAAAAMLGEAWNRARFLAARTRVEQHFAGGQLREAFEGAKQLLERARVAGEQAYPDADYDLAVVLFLLARVLWRIGGQEQALALLNEARQRFEAIENTAANRDAEVMLGRCFEETGHWFLDLGRLEEAAGAYEECVRRAEQLDDAREIAVGMGQLGTVRLEQGRFEEALAAYAEARERFTKLDEPGSVALIWHQTGRVNQEAGEAGAAEDAYRKSLGIRVQLGDVAGQASTLAQLGNLYDDSLNRPEEAVGFYRQAADRYVEIGDAANEGRARNNLGDTLRKLRRFDEARHEIRRAIECKEPFGHAATRWTSWAILADIETEVGNSAAAAEARGKAIDTYLAYRLDGGENHSGPGRLVFDMTKELRNGGPDAAASFLQRVAATPGLHELLPFIRALKAIVAGSRDPVLADAPELDYTMAAELLLLIETLERPPAE